MIGTHRAKLKGKRGVYHPSDSRQELSSCIHSRNFHGSFQYLFVSCCFEPS